jgi:hypothetical protein
MEGRFDQAISAYQSIQAKNPKLTALNLVIAGVYRQKAEREQDSGRGWRSTTGPSPRTPNCSRANGDHSSAQFELGMTQLAAGNAAAAAKAFQGRHRGESGFHPRPPARPRTSTN